MYFCHGTHLARFGEPLVDGYFEAWDHGPVHPLIWREFNEFRSNPITRKSFSTNLVTGEKKLVQSPKEQIVKTLIAETVLQLRQLTASQLREKSHAIGGPWHSVIESAKINLASRLRIPDSVILQLYHRHILPISRSEDHEDVIEDFPPQPDGCGEHIASTNLEKTPTVRED
jgi:uncharacterized phage-associated protein